MKGKIKSTGDYSSEEENVPQKAETDPEVTNVVLMGWDRRSSTIIGLKWSQEGKTYCDGLTIRASATKTSNVATCS